MNGAWNLSIDVMLTDFGVSGFVLELISRQIWTFPKPDQKEQLGIIEPD